MPSTLSIVAHAAPVNGRNLCCGVRALRGSGCSLAAGCGWALGLRWVAHRMCVKRSTTRSPGVTTLQTPRTHNVPQRSPSQPQLRCAWTPPAALAPCTPWLSQTHHDSTHKQISNASGINASTPVGLCSLHTLTRTLRNVPQSQTELRSALLASGRYWPARTQFRGKGPACCPANPPADLQYKRPKKHISGLQFFTAVLTFAYAPAGCLASCTGRYCAVTRPSGAFGCSGDPRCCAPRTLVPLLSLSLLPGRAAVRDRALYLSSVCEAMCRVPVAPVIPRVNH